MPDKHPFSIVHEDDALGHVPADFDDIAGAEQDTAVICAAFILAIWIKNA